MIVKKLENWWDNFKYTVDDLILRSNVHDCGKNQSTKNEKTPKKDRPTCINKQGKCKARYPRPLVEQTEVDPKTGALNMKKGEAWINTFTPIVTYLLRCNTDVTSLLSGTAIKAIVAYVSDYVTKPGLKTYVIFDTIRSIFDRNSEMLSSSLDRQEKARRLMCQIVNSLTSKMEIGGPRASLYLLGNPDHYTNMKFVAVYWKSYVREVLTSWRSPEDLDDQVAEKVVIQKSNSKYVGFSAVHDYMYRPEAFGDITLYEWVQMATRCKVTKSRKPEVQTDTPDELDLIGQDDQPSESKPDIKPAKVQFCDDKSDADTDELNLEDNDSDFEDVKVEDDDDAISEVKTTGKRHAFLKDHPLYKTHQIEFNKKRNQIVPNFVGGSLPRRDRGDREYYCATMLTFFKPWRTGKDLKTENYSWDETFNDHQFTPRQLELMQFFNIRYECNDARDDFSTQLKKGDTLEGVPQWMSSEIVDDMDDIDQLHHDDDHDDEEYHKNKYSEPGTYGKRRIAEMEAAKIGVKEAGWLDESPNGVADVDKTPLQPDVVQLGTKWKATVNEQRQEVLGE